MKKVLLTLGCFAAVGVGISQNLPKERPVMISEMGETLKSNKQSIFGKTGEPVWSENFETFDGWTTDGLDGDHWYRSEPIASTLVPAGWGATAGESHYDYLLHPEYEYYPRFYGLTTDRRILSPTVDNGFAMVDSDSWNNTDGGTFNQNIMEAMLVSPVIDLSASAGEVLGLKFNQSTRLCCAGASEIYVDITTDGFNTFYTHDAREGAALNAIDREKLVEIIMAPALEGGNLETVQFRFRFSAGASHYFWMVDDIDIVSVPEFDLRLDRVLWGSLGNWEESLSYYQVPLTQITSISFSGEVTNVGGSAQSDVVFTAEIPAASFAGSSAPTPLAVVENAILNATTSYTPSDLGAFTIDGEVSSSNEDANPDRNVINGAATFTITDDVYARDAGTRTGGWRNIDADGDALPFEVGNVFDIFANDEVAAAIVDISPTSTIGSSLYAILYDVSDGNFNFVDETDIIEVTADNRGQLVELDFLLGPHTVFGGGTYMVVAASFGGPDGGLVVGSSGTIPAQTGYYKDDTNTWYFITTAAMVRMKMAGPANVENFVAGDFKLKAYPNPAQDILNLSFDLENASDVQITLTDMSGKVVYTSTEQNVFGENEMTISTQGLTNGVYFCNFVANGTSVVNKIVVNK